MEWLHLDDDLPARLAVAMLLFISGFAIWQGRWPERWMGGSLVIAQIVYLLIYNPDDRINTHWAIFFQDLAFFVWTAFLAIKSRRGWTNYACAFQMLAVAGHLALAFDLRIQVYTYFAASALWTYAVEFALLFGTVQVILERRKIRLAQGPNAEEPPERFIS